jgi:hypothetical protein
MRAHCLLVCALALCGCGDSGPSPTPDLKHADLFATSDILPWGCSPTSCTGTNCCQGQLSSQCVPGTTVAACGYAGNACAVCGSSQECKDGYCRSPSCDATTCATGCCANGACKPGTTDDACGSGGTACSVCDGSANKVCMNNKCTVKGSGSYQVFLVSCTIEHSWGDNACGLESNCDPYVILTVGKTKGQSSIKLDTDKPLWNEMLLNATEGEITTSFDIEIYDDDYGPDDQPGKCSWKVTTTELAAGKMTQHCGSPFGTTYVKDLTFEFKPI